MTIAEQDERLVAIGISVMARCGNQRLDFPLMQPVAWRLTPNIAFFVGWGSGRVRDIPQLLASVHASNLAQLGQKVQCEMSPGSASLGRFVGRSILDASTTHDFDEVDLGMVARVLPVKLREHAQQIQLLMRILSSSLSVVRWYSGRYLKVCSLRRREFTH